MNTMTSSPISCPEFIPPELARKLADGRRWLTPCGDGHMVWHEWGRKDHPVVVLLHGGSGSWTHWLHAIAPLRDAGWRVLAPDLPGMGDSTLPPDCIDTDDLPPYLHAGLAMFKPHPDVRLVGFSFGGMTAALWLRDFPGDARQLVLVGAPGMGIKLPDRLPLKGWRHLATQEEQDAVHRYNLMALMLHRPESLDALTLDLHRHNVERDRMQRRRLSGTPIVADSLPKVQASVSAIYGEHDALYLHRLPEVSAAMPALAPVWGEWHTVAGSGHWVQHEAPEAFNRVLLGTLRALP